MKGLPEVWIDGTVYVTLAMLTILISELRNVTAEELNNWTWINYTIFFATVMSSGFLALKTFRSESISKHRTEVRLQAAKDEGDSKTEVTTKETKTETVETVKVEEPKINKVETETVTTDNKDSDKEKVNKEKEDKI